MLMKDIKVGEEYVASHYRERGDADLLTSFGRPDSKAPYSKEWADSWRGVLEGLFGQIWRHKRVRVIEKGVPVSLYARPGVLVVELDRQTGEPLPDAKPVAMRTVQLAIEWERGIAVYLDALSEHEAYQQERREDEERRQRERQEKAAKDWMEREFQDARDTLQDLVAIGAIEAFTEERVKALVEQRNPDGNPYLTGEEVAY